MDRTTNPIDRLPGLQTLLLERRVGRAYMCHRTRHVPTSQWWLIDQGGFPFTDRKFPEPIRSRYAYPTLDNEKSQLDQTVHNLDVDIHRMQSRKDATISRSCLKFAVFKWFCQMSQLG
uniref:Uncharacterized protein n=1 Tax=Spongospora subterranea TaxID=70186 RepID=A0A0H5QR16_9EUKA|eukprot:CRZ04465.1 hypothetical protein [Spongospora subterranea]